MVTKIIKKDIIKPQIKHIPNLIRVMTRDKKERIIIDSNKEKDYKTKYLHISWNEFID